jgi:hypothetical protein
MNALTYNPQFYIKESKEVVLHEFTTAFQDYFMFLLFHLNKCDEKGRSLYKASNHLSASLVKGIGLNYSLKGKSWTTACSVKNKILCQFQRGAMRDLQYEKVEAPSYRFR